MDKNRIVEVRTMDASELKANDGNFKVHPDSQKQAFSGVISEIGKAGALVAYYSERNDGQLTLIDGHMRQDSGGEWTVLITDLDDQEADKLLQVYDPISAFADIDQKMLGDLAERAAFLDASVGDMVKALNDMSIGSVDVGSQYEPNLAPTTSQAEVTDEDIRKAQEAANKRFEVKPDTQRLVTCPHCAEDFYVKD
tara:strand:+ start:1452 stop:2039 length:588 start_codon:yes stop_codon:yes gene_type:complete